MRIFFVTFIAAIFLLQNAKAADWQEGYAKYRAGDVAGALAILVPIAEQEKKPEQQTQLGLIYVRKQNFLEAKNWLSLAAEQGYAQAEYNLGSLYYKGDGTEKNYHAALKWYKKAAAQNNAMAMHKIGYMYNNGLGVETDYRVAANWYNQAADLGYADSMYNIGVLLILGQGFEKDISAAVSWFTLAAYKNHANAQYDLASIYDEGKYVPADYAEAAKWYRKAGEQGHRDAYYNLARLHALGEYGLPVNYIEAYKYALIAQNRDKLDTTQLESILLSVMTEAQVREASKLAIQCVADKYKGC